MYTATLSPKTHMLSVVWLGFASKVRIRRFISLSNAGI
jgi:hypothetical protein